MIQITAHPIPVILSRQPLFRDMSDAELDELSSGTREFRLAKNELLFSKGHVPEGMYVIVMGQIKLFLSSPQGADKTIHLAAPGDTFGEESVFANQPYPVSAQATKDSILLLVGRPALSRALEGNGCLCHALMTRMATRLYDLFDQMETCVQFSSLQRVIHYLTQRAPTDADHYDLLLDTKQTIASQLNLAPETLSRVLSQLSRGGYIQMKGRNVTVLKRHQLLQAMH
ncbi:MAG: Crp/Fnr family transcriptional regulator [Thiobacillaceae bacterium]|jgi:CRP-like cAMP-binding protein|nr:Crp/Fnr family transcriptional regulator [Thiobacillaceae bacterium]